MPEWLIERGIGETRAVLVVDSQIVEARIHLDGTARAGAARQAVLKSVGPPSIAFDGRDEYLLPNGAPGVTEGAALTVEVTREKIPGPEPWKRPLARVTSSLANPPPGGRVVPFPGPENALDAAGWQDILEEARTSTIHFAGGELTITPTRAMTVIDVDGKLAADELAVCGAEAAARAIRRLDIGGSIGIDLPTVGSKAVRQGAAAAIDAVLPQPFERTAVNGFGFVQIVRPRRRASLVELAQDPVTFEARALLRRAAFEGAGAKRLAANPAVIAILEAKPDWLDALARQIGGAITLRVDAKLPIHGGYAEKV